jgi:DNA-binding FrmR family transcriptional regulator
VRVSNDLTAEETARLLNRLRRVEGQARGLQRMIEEGRSCEEVFTQLSATKAALDRVGVMLISLKMRSCLMEEGADPNSQEAVEKALETFLKYATAVRWEAGTAE